MAIIIIESPPPQVVPGEPFSVQWSCTMNGPEPPSVTATLMLGSNQLQTGSFPTKPNAPPPFPSGWWTSGGTLTANLSPTDPGGRDVYSIGVKTLQLQLSAGTTGEADIPFAVLPTKIDGSWWTFNAPPSQADWKTTYNIAGMFSNEDQWSAMSTVLATLAENGTDLQTLNLGSVGSETNTGPVAFDPITQTWQWMDDTTFVNVASTIKTFAYTVGISAQDPWDNQYQITSAPVSVVVSVPLWKINDQTAALAAAANAVNLLAAAGVAAATFQWELAAAAWCRGDRVCRRTTVRWQRKGSTRGRSFVSSTS